MNGKAVIGWLKKHWLIVVFGVVAVAALPAALFFAQTMNDGIVKKFEGEVAKDYTSVAGSTARVSYSVPGVDGSKVLEKSAEANQAMIDRYAAIWDQIKTKTGAVSEKGLAFNKSDHKLLVEGLFPRPDELSEKVRRRDFMRAFIEFHQRILAEARAGMPAEAEALARDLSDYALSQRERIKADQGRDPTPEETAKIAQELQDMRISRYRARAAELGVYASIASFEGVPTDVLDTAPPLVSLWDLQERAWMHHDLLRAITAANGNSAGGVNDGVVKRVIKIAVNNSAWNTADGNPAPQAYDAGEDKAPTDLSRSVTGRVSGPGTRNRWFDVRTAQLDLVVSSRRLPAFIDALSATNFISVLDLDLARVEPLADLREGFAYGDEHVVRASLSIEFVLLREWRKDAMPEDVKRALGMADGVEAGMPSAPAAAPAARPSRPTPQGAGGGAAPRGGRPAGRGGRDE